CAPCSKADPGTIRCIGGPNRVLACWLSPRTALRLPVFRPGCAMLYTNCVALLRIAALRSLGRPAGFTTNAFSGTNPVKPPCSFPWPRHASWAGSNPWLSRLPRSWSPPFIERTPILTWRTPIWVPMSPNTTWTSAGNYASTTTATAATLLITPNGAPKSPGRSSTPPPRTSRAETLNEGRHVYSDHYCANRPRRQTSPGHRRHPRYRQRHHARLRAAGATVVVAARSAPSTSSPRVITADIATANGSATIAERTLAILGGVDIVVHNVGGSGVSPGSVTDLTDDDWDQAFQVNLFGAVRLDRALVPSMIAGQSGVIIHITSVQRRLPMPGSAPYAAAKAALANYSKALSDELAPSGIRVNSVCPGFIETDAAAAFVSEHAAALQISTDDARAQVIKSIGGIPLGRAGDPADVGDLVAFLASDRARYLTGTEFLIDGGSTRAV